MKPEYNIAVPKKGDILQNRKPTVKWPMKIVCIREDRDYVHILFKHTDQEDTHSTVSRAKGYFWGSYEYYEPDYFDEGSGI